MHLIATALRIAPAKAMIEAHFQHGGGRHVSGDVSAHPRAIVKALQHHGRRIPAHQVFQPLLKLHIPRIARLIGNMDAVHIGCVQRQGGQQITCAGGMLPAGSAADRNNNLRPVRQAGNQRLQTTPGLLRSRKYRHVYLDLP